MFNSTAKGIFQSTVDCQWLPVGSAPGYITADFSVFTATIDGTFTGLPGDITADFELFSGESFAGSSIYGDTSFELFTCTIDGNFDIPTTIFSDFEPLTGSMEASQTSQILADLPLFDWEMFGGASIYGDTNFALFEGAVYGGAECVGDFGLFSGEISGAGAIFAEFQAFNGTGWADLATITGSFSVFTADIGGEAVFNHIHVDLPRFIGTLSGGGAISSSMVQLNGSSTGVTGVSLGINASMLPLDGGMDSGAEISESSFGSFTGGMDGVVGHVSRITSSFSLLDATLSGYVGRNADIAGNTSLFSCSMVARQENPANISATGLSFTGFMTGSHAASADIEGDFLSWGSGDRITGINGELPFLIGDMMEFTGRISSSVDIGQDALRHVRGEIR